MTACGGQDEYAEIRAVIVKRPQEAFLNQSSVAAQWQALNYLDEPNYELACAQHAAFVAQLGRLGAEVCYLPASDTTGLDSIYVRDCLLISGRGAILCSMGKAARRGEPAAIGAFIEGMGIPMLGAIGGDGRLEGGDVVWLDQHTVAVGQGYRTNLEGINQLRALLGDSVSDVIPVPLPHWTGPADCLHLMSNLSPVDRDLAVVYSRLLSVPFRQLLLERGFELVEVPDEEYATQGCNVLAIAPRQCLMLAGNPITRARLEAAGARVYTYEGSDISLKGAGGPTCLTRPFWRA
jgi:N-dimethylarginine dimethylaminohydrolase